MFSVCSSLLLQSSPAFVLRFLQRALGLAIAAMLLLLPTLSAQEIPANYFGMHVNSYQHWPSAPIGVVRGANVAWRVLNPSRGAYDWRNLDNWVSAAEQHGVDYSYLFLATPQWASSRPHESCYAGAIGCAAPPANLRDWDDFVTAVAKRYRGRIRSYEIWNEPNDTHYWTGSIDQMLNMAEHAYRIIKSIDPQAIVISPSPTYSSSGPPHTWLQAYLSKGGGAYADVIGFHGYVGGNPEAINSVVSKIKEVINANGLGSRELWDTEAAWGRDSSIADPRARAAFLAKYYILQASQGVQRFFWYQWDNPSWGTLWDQQNGVNEAGRAYEEVYHWLVGATFVRPCTQQSDDTFVCTIRRDGTNEQIVWNTRGARLLKVDRNFTRARHLGGAQTDIDAHGLDIDNVPVKIR